LLIYLVMIDAELDSENHNSIPAIVIRWGFNNLMLELTPNQIRRLSRPDTVPKTNQP
jgi:hypothetical protein